MVRERTFNKAIAVRKLLEDALVAHGFDPSIMTEQYGQPNVRSRSRKLAEDVELAYSIESDQEEILLLVVVHFTCAEDLELESFKVSWNHPHVAAGQGWSESFIPTGDLDNPPRTPLRQGSSVKTSAPSGPIVDSTGAVFLGK